MDSTSLMLSMLFGSIGAGYFVYGKKQERLVALICGVLLIAFPYFVDSAWIVSGVSVALMVAPFVFRV